MNLASYCNEKTVEKKDTKIRIGTVLLNWAIGNESLGS